MLDVHMIIITVILYKYIILLLVVYLHLCAVINKNENDKLQLYGDNVILLKLGNTLCCISFYISNYLYTFIIQ